MATFDCHYCGRSVSRPAGHVNRARAHGDNLYCGRVCAGLGRRGHKTKAQKVAEKREYDARYRILNAAKIKARRAAYFKQTYDPAKAAVERKRRAPAHAEYCRRPEYRAWKHDYDEKYNAKRNYGPFSEAFRVCIDLNREIKERMTNVEIRCENGTWGKRQTRARACSEKATRDRDRSTFGVELT